MEYIAFDAHKRYTQVSVETAGGERRYEGRITHARCALQQFLATCEHGSSVALGTVGNWYWIVDEIEAAGQVPQPVHARMAKLMLGMENKTDNLDARGLNRLLRTGTLPTVWIPPGALRDQRDLLPPGPHHCPPHLVQHRPGRPVIAQAKRPPHSQGAGTHLLAGHVPPGARPHREWHLRILEGGSSGHRRLTAALRTPLPISANVPRRTLPAPRTAPAIRPSKRGESCSTRFSFAVPGLQFWQCLGEILLAHRRGHYMWGKVASGGYPQQVMLRR